MESEKVQKDDEHEVLSKSAKVADLSMDPRGGGDRRAAEMVTFLHFWC